MKNRLLFLLSSIGIISCNATEPQQEREGIAFQNNVVSESDTNISERHSSGPEQPAPTEYLEWQNMKINNLLLLDTNIGHVKALFGKADSTTTPDYENICPNCHFCYEKISAFKYAYYKAVTFEQLNDSLVFWSADFTLDKSLFLQNGKMRFNHKTTLKEVGKLFPEAVRAKRTEESGSWIRISPYKELVDGDFILEFNNKEYLTKFSYWFPC